MDNYFTSFRLFVCLPTLELTTLGVKWASGVFNKNRLRKYTIIGDIQLQKKERGHCEQSSTNQAKTLCKLYGWFEGQQGVLRSCF